MSPTHFPNISGEKSRRCHDSLWLTFKRIAEKIPIISSLCVCVVRAAYPGKPTQVSVKEGAAAATFSLGLPVVDGGSPITGYILQWRQSAQQEWNQTVIQATGKVFTSHVWCPMIVLFLKQTESECLYHVKFKSPCEHYQNVFYFTCSQICPFLVNMYNHDQSIISGRGSEH